MDSGFQVISIFNGLWTLLETLATVHWFQTKATLHCLTPQLLRKAGRPWCFPLSWRAMEKLSPEHPKSLRVPRTWPQKWPRPTKLSPRHFQIATSAEPAPDRPHSRHWYSYTWHCRKRICKAGTCASAIPTVPGVGNAKNRKGPWGSKKGRGTHVCIALFREAVHQHRVPTLQSISSQNALMIPAHQSCNPTPSVYILQTQTTHACMWHMWHHMWFKRRLHQLQNHQHFVWQGNALSRLLRTAMRIQKGYGVDRTKENWLLLLAVCIFL